MAIWSYGTTPPINKVVDDILYTSKTGKTHRLQRANQNRNKQTVHGMVNNSQFGNLDQLIVQLDGMYDQSANQAAWITYAANISGQWDLCANCAPGASGKKLYRQYNLNRVMMLLNIVDIPINNTAYAAYTWVETDVTYTGGVLAITQTLAADIGNIGGFFIFRETGAYNALRITLEAADIGANVPGSAHIAAFVSDLQPYLTDLGGGVFFRQFSVCQCDPDGAPGRQLNNVVTLRT